jgi:beta propeller repeat protein
MSRFKLFVFMIICLSVTVIVSITSGIVISPVCTNPSDQWYPAISGDTIVWMDHRNETTTGWDIYKWDPMNGEQQVCTLPGDQRDPAISGETIVWNDNQNGGAWDIYMWDPVNGTRAVCTEPIDQWYPAISGDTIVWQDNRNWATTGIDIYMWDPVNGEQQVCTQPGDQWDAAISGDKIVWMDNRNYTATGWDIYMWDPVNGEQQVCTQPDDQLFPAISGDTIVWEDGRTTESDIYMWDPVNGEQQVCIQPGYQYYPEISGDTIVWTDSRNSASTGYDIYMWDPGNGEQQVCTEPSEQRDPAISGDTIVWMDDRDQATTGPDIYKAVLSPPPVSNFTSNGTTGAAPLSVEFYDTSLGEDLSYLWEFGDGNTSDEQNPVYVYLTPGTFNVSLTVTNQDGSDTETKSDYITVSVPVTVKIRPRIINLGRDGYVLAFVTLPDEYKFAMVDKNTVSCSGASPVRMIRMLRYPKYLGFIFKTSHLEGINPGKNVSFSLSGQLKTKGITYSFTGSDMVYVIRISQLQPDDIQDISKLSDDQLFTKYLT